MARDRASAYASAINKILPDCVQVADRFHLLQNLIDRLKDIFKEGLPPEIYIKDGVVLDKAPDKIWKEKLWMPLSLTSIRMMTHRPLKPTGRKRNLSAQKGGSTCRITKGPRKTGKKTGISPEHPKPVAAFGKQEICHDCVRIRGFNCQCEKIYTDDG